MKKIRQVVSQAVDRKAVNRATDEKPKHTMSTSERGLPVAQAEASNPPVALETLVERAHALEQRALEIVRKVDELIASALMPPAQSAML